MAERVKEANKKVCSRLKCNTLRNGTPRDFLITFTVILVIVIVRVVILGVIFGYGFLPVYYLYFPLMAVIQITLLVAEAVILFRRTGLFALVMLLHLLIFCPAIAMIAFIPWSLVGLLLYGLFYNA